MSLDDDHLESAIAAAHAAGRVLLEMLGGPLEVACKSSPNDLVSSADRAAEAVLIAALQRACPEASILAEESGLVGRAEAEGPLPPPGGLRWVIDPLDGTTNFSRGIPHFAVSVALCDNHGPRVGVVHDPVRAETFAAVRGRGAALRRSGRAERVLAVTRTEALARALLATGFAYDRVRTGVMNLAEVSRLIPKIACLRRAGSAALDLAYVAAGRLDGYWEYHLQPWDVAAGALLVAEAGGEVLSLRGGPFEVGCGDLVAAGPDLLPILLAELRAARGAG